MKFSQKLINKFLKNRHQCPKLKIYDVKDFNKNKHKILEDIKKFKGSSSRSSSVKEDTFKKLMQENIKVF